MILYIVAVISFGSPKLYFFKDTEFEKRAACAVAIADDGDVYSLTIPELKPEEVYSHTDIGNGMCAKIK